MHTLHSDGSLSTRELVTLARSKNLSCIALTDHDTVSGVDEACNVGKELGVEVIPGIEISAIFEPGTMHILGYFLDPTNSELLAGLAPIQNARSERNPKIIQKLRELGIDITLEEVEKVSGGDQVGRPHFARVLIDKGYAKASKEVFAKYLGKGCPAYVDKRRVTSKQAIDLIHKAGGVASLAHPKQLKVPHGEHFEREIAKLKEEGLDGIEVFSSSQNSEESAYYLKIAKQFDLVVTGGSDFHGSHKPGIELGWMGSGVHLYYDTIERLRARIR